MAEKKEKELSFKHGKDTYVVPPKLKISLPGGKVTAEDILKDEDLQKKLVKAGVKSIKKK